MNRFAKLALPSLLAIGAAAVLGTITTSATAGTFTVRGGDSASNVGPCQTFDATMPFPLVASGGCFQSPAGGAQSSAGAGFGSLQAESRVVSFTNGTVVRWDTVAAFSDTVTFSAADPNATTAIVSVNLVLSGEIGIPGINLFSSFRASGRIQNQLFSIQIAPQTGIPLTLQSVQQTGGVIFDPSGLVLAFFATDPIEVPLDQPVIFELSIESSALAVNANTMSIADFGSFSSGVAVGNGIGLPIDADAFNLPGGVTVNSGNRLIDNRVVVPEPETGVMLLAGLGFLAAVTRRALDTTPFHGAVDPSSRARHA